MKRTSSTASLLSTKRVLFFRVRRQPRQDSKKDEWAIPMDNLPLTKHCSGSLCRMQSLLLAWNRDQVIFYRACQFDLMIFIWHKTPTSPQALWTRTLQWKGACNESVAAPFLRWNGGWLRIGNERVAAVKSWLLPYCGWKRRWLHLNGRDQPCFIDKTRAPVLLLSRRGSLFLRGRFSHAYFLETLRGLFDIFVVVVVYIVIPKKIALRH